MRKSKAATSDVADPEPEATPEAPRPDSVRTSLEALDGDRVKMTVSVDEAEFEQAVDRAFRKLAHEVRLPGFRPGKAPRRLLESRLGTTAGRHEAIQDLSLIHI